MLKSWLPNGAYPTSKPARATETHAWLSQAQQHISFLHHLERGELQNYKFPLWKNPPGTVSDAFIVLPNGNNTMSSSKQNVLIDGKGVVSHYDDAVGAQGLDSTDILDRYRKYAEEHICYAD